MNQGGGSLTALVTAFVRAYHSAHGAPTIFDDSIARQLFTDDEFSRVGKQLTAALAALDPESAAACSDEATALAVVIRDYSGPIPLSRARYTEDELAAAFLDGIGQYVIMGAGLDTFAFRRPKQMNGLRVFELDHPLTQGLKRERLAARGRDEPANVHFVPIDFTMQLVDAALLGPQYDSSTRTLINWSGVTYYLDRDSVFDVLRSLAEIVPCGSTLLFDYLDPDAFIEGKAALRVQRMLAFVQQAGEPMKSCLEPATLDGDLASVGWQLTENLNPAQIEERYFQDRTDGYHAFEHIHFARAVIA